jgi:prephenate dehydrogenase
MAGRAGLVGTGLIGGSIGMALRRQGWHVAGVDLDPDRAARALELGALDEVGRDPHADLTFVATPVGAVADLSRAVLESGPGVVTDVGSVKGPIVRAVNDARFVGGHPMAGSEQEGVDGARADLFEGAVWVLTPDDSTDETAYTTVRSAVSAFGAEVVAIPPDRHDALVAVVSHVPHLTAATLMALADERSADHRALLRLAAGGFRDMTRVAAGHPGIWPDICTENRGAIVETLDRLITALGQMRDVVAEGDREALLGRLDSARVARANLPVRFSRPDQLTELRVPVPDRPGALAEVTTLATELDVNIADLELAHSAEGDKGVMILLVESTESHRLTEALHGRGYVVAERRLEGP